MASTDPQSKNRLQGFKNKGKDQDVSRKLQVFLDLYLNINLQMCTYYPLTQDILQKPYCFFVCASLFNYLMNDIEPNKFQFNLIKFIYNCVSNMYFFFVIYLQLQLEN